MTNRQRQKAAKVRRELAAARRLINFTDSWLFEREMEARGSGVDDPNLDALRRRFIRYGFDRFSRKSS